MAARLGLSLFSATIFTGGDSRSAQDLIKPQNQATKIPLRATEENIFFFKV